MPRPVTYLYLLLASDWATAWLSPSQRPLGTSRLWAQTTPSSAEQWSPLPPRTELVQTKQPSSRRSRRRKARNETVAERALPEQIPKLSDILQAPTTHAIATKKNAPWQADYHTSRQTQQRIQAAANSPGSPFQRATKILQTLLSTDPSACNAANLVCALTLSAKMVGRQTSDELRSLLWKTSSILEAILPTLSARQLCNAAWALAKHFDRDARLLPPPPQATAALSSERQRGRAELLDLRAADTPAERMNRVVDKMACQLAALLEKNGQIAKPAELCMASWAYGVLRPRQRPAGWKQGPQVGQLPLAKQQRRRRPGQDVITFEQWVMSDDDDNDHADEDPREPVTACDTLLDTIAMALTAESEGSLLGSQSRVSELQWRELANVAWAFATHGRSSSAAAQELLLSIASEAAYRLRQGGALTKQVLSRDIAQLIWSLGILQSDNFRLADGLLEMVEALNTFKQLSDAASKSTRPYETWSCADIVQVVLSLAHARLDEMPLLRALYTEADRRLGQASSHTARPTDGRTSFHAWEISILLWAQARLYLKSPQGTVFERFAGNAARELAERSQAESLTDIGIGAQEQANIVWSLTVLEEYDEPLASSLIARIYNEAAENCEKDGMIHLEHAHQLWQALFLLEEECPEAVAGVPSWFYEYLRDKWIVEKARPKVSSARHRALSVTLDLMGVSHKNEHDEDIDVAIVLKPQASWTHETETTSISDGVRVAVEFDGPNHFTRQRESPPGVKPEKPRTLGHTVLKYRLLKKQGWAVVRVPYYEFDKIPFWASMERQRYLQRLLKTHGNLRFSEVDKSVYKAPVASRASRFD